MERFIVTDLTLDRIALTRSPAQDGAEIVLAKSRDGDLLAKMKPKDGESEDDYVSRMMGDAGMKSEFTDEKQRAAAAHSMFKKKSTAKAAAPKAGDDAMTDQEKQELAKAIAKAERAEKIIALSATERAHFDSLKGDAQDGFLALAPAAKSEEIAKAAAKAAEADPVIYKSKTTGQEYRKSADPALVSLAKSHDELVAKHAASEAEKADMILKSRAETEIPFMPGTAETKVAILRQIDQIADPAVKSAALESLKAQNAQMAKAFERIGHSGDVVAKAGSPADRLDSIAKAAAAKSGKSYEAEYDAALKTPEGRKLYAEMAAAGSVSI